MGPLREVCFQGQSISEGSEGLDLCHWRPDQMAGHVVRRKAGKQEGGLMNRW